tara:strand:- start:284 stop:418 length:135 start_codon:yes stop_codon:yes gene_type:complete
MRNYIETRETLDVEGALTRGRFLQAEAFHNYARRAVKGFRRLFV